jgi:hypothetical protein
MNEFNNDVIQSFTLGFIKEGKMTVSCSQHAALKIKDDLQTNILDKYIK